MRTVFLGNDRWSVPSLEALDGSRHEVSRVLTRVPRPAGRGSRLTPTAVSEAAHGLGLPLTEVETVKAGPGRDALEREPFDVLVVVAYGEILPGDALALPRVAPVNVHFSMLPALRGAAPVQRAILEGLPETGVTTIRMDEGMDTGPILLQVSEEIHEDDDAGTLGARLSSLGGALLVETLDRMASGTSRERPQEHARATFAPKLAAGERVIDWGDPATAVVRRVRALAPRPGAATTFRGRTLKVLRATAVPEAAVPRGTRPGTVLEDQGGLVVATGDGAVVTVEVAPEGRRHMTGEAFVRGYRPEVGETLG